MSTLVYNKDHNAYSNEQYVIHKDVTEGGKWILTDKATDKRIDKDQYRNDLAERNNLKLSSF